MNTVPTYKVVVRNRRHGDEHVVEAGILDRAAAIARFEGLLRADRDMFWTFRPDGLWQLLVLPGKEIAVPPGVTLHRVRSSTTWPTRHGMLAARS